MSAITSLISHDFGNKCANVSMFSSNGFDSLSENYLSGLIRKENKKTNHIGIISDKSLNYNTKITILKIILMLKL